MELPLRINCPGVLAAVDSVRQRVPSGFQRQRRPENASPKFPAVNQRHPFLLQNCNAYLNEILNHISGTCVILLLGVISASCAYGKPSTPPQAASVVSASSHAMKKTPSLFSATDEVGAIDSAPQVVRQRFVKVNLGLLLDERGRARDLKEITINLFPDVLYTGVIEQVETDGSGYSWRGFLKEAGSSSVFMVYTAGVFMGHFASPAGIYEVSAAGQKDLYRVVLIDQQKFPEGGD
jgi:hypothetical protein